MTLVQLSYIIAVDTYRHFATAAEHCYVTQPTLSMQIHKLEEELGLSIFDRTKQPIVPTDIGEKIIAQARAILKESERVQDIIDIEKAEFSGDFRIGIIPTVAPYIVPRFLKNFTEKYPKINLTIDEIQTHQIVKKLDNDLLDIGMLATPLTENYFQIQPVFYEPLVGYIHEKHELYEKEKINGTDLNRDDMLLLDEGNCFREQTIMLCQHFKDKKNARKPMFESGNLETLKKLVDQHYGITVLPKLMVEDLGNPADFKKVRPFIEPTPKREISVVYGHRYLKKHIINVFINEIKSVLSEDMKTREGSLILDKAN
jgi:LysR family hydrogen peroxide-inducible transcriptional activator